MPALRVSCRLPAGMKLPSGQYGNDAESKLILDEEPILRDGRVEVRLGAHMDILAPDDLDAEGKEAFQTQMAQRFLRRVNLLIRWYRHIMQSALVSEMSLAQASPIHFTEVAIPRLWGVFVARPVTISSTHVGATEDAVRDIRKGFDEAAEPPTESILLLDARAASYEGRFREAVLFCWSAIDSTFSRRFESLVDAKLADEWSRAREFVKGIDFGLRHRMTVGMRLVAGKSFFTEPANFWSNLSTSYDRRNAIIHRGESANERDAQLALQVAESVVTLMNQFAAISAPLPSA